MDTRLILVLLLLIIVYLLHIINKKKYNYWKDKSVPYIKPWPILGNYGQYILQQEYVGSVIQKLCQQFPNAPYFGAFFGTEPVLIVQSPDLLKQILTKDFHSFNGREISNYTSKEVITQGVFFTSGLKWKAIRQTLTPLFSSTKMKNMFNLIEKCNHMFEDMLDLECSLFDVIEIKNFSARYTMDCITACAFGINANTMLKPKNNIFQVIASEIFKTTFYRGFKLVFRAAWPDIFYGLGFQCFPPALNEFFSKLLKNVTKERNYEPSTRNDFVDLLLYIKKDHAKTDNIENKNTDVNENEKFKMDDDVMVALCFAFFAAGYETSASALSLTLFELAKNPDIQKQAAKEVDEFLRHRGNKLDYECINELPYLEGCLYETLRKYPVLGYITREVMEDYVFSNGLHLDKGLRIHIPVYYMHHNPEYFPEPDKYNPERFLPKNKNNIKQYTFFPYGEGPRICIGKRFSKMQVLTGLVSFLKKYRVELAKGMPQDLILESKTLVTQPKGKRLSKLQMFAGLVTILKKYRVELAQPIPQIMPLETRTFSNQPMEVDLMLKVYPREEWEHRVYIRN